MQPIKLAIINGFITFSFWSIMALFLSTNLSGAISFIIFALIPISVLVTWRSKLIAPQLINGLVTIKSYAIDGFKWGVISGVVFWTWSISIQVFAAGNSLMDASLAQILKFIFTISLPTTLVFGFMGFIHSIIFFYLNRWLVVNYS